MTEVDTEWRNSHQRTEKEEYQKKPHRASFFEFHVQEKRGSSASSFSLHLITDSPSEKLAPMGLCQFPHSERHQEPAWAARKKSPTLPSPAGVCRGNCKRGIPVVILASGETNRMMNESLGQAALGLDQQDRYQMEQVHSMGYSPLGKVCLKERE